MSPKIKFREMIRQRLPKWKADVTGQAIKIERKWLEESRWVFCVGRKMCRLPHVSCHIFFLTVVMNIYPRDKAGQLGKHIMAASKQQFYLDQTIESTSSEVDSEVDNETKNGTLCVDYLRGESCDGTCNRNHTGRISDDVVVELTDIFKCFHMATLTNGVAEFKEQFINDRHNQLKVSIIEKDRIRVLSM